MSSKEKKQQQKHSPQNTVSLTDNLFNKWCLEKLVFIYKKPIKLEPYLILYTNISPKWNKFLNWDMNYKSHRKLMTKANNTKIDLWLHQTEQFCHTKKMTKWKDKLLILKLCDQYRIDILKVRDLVTL